MVIYRNHRKVVVVRYTYCTAAWSWWSCELFSPKTSIISGTKRTNYWRAHTPRSGSVAKQMMSVACEALLLPLLRHEINVCINRTKTLTLDFCSLKVILLSFAQFDILLISMFAKFSASRTVSALTAISKSSAKAIACFVFRIQNWVMSYIECSKYQARSMILVESLRSLLFPFVRYLCWGLLSFH